jgi:hypothetical protein
MLVLNDEAEHKADIAGSRAESDNINRSSRRSIDRSLVVVVTVKS